jgi:hypothetical protein
LYTQEFFAKTRPNFGFDCGNGAYIDGKLSFGVVSVSAESHSTIYFAVSFAFVTSGCMISAFFVEMR